MPAPGVRSIIGPLGAALEALAPAGAAADTAERGLAPAAAGACRSAVPWGVAQVLRPFLFFCFCCVPIKSWLYFGR